MTLRQFASVVLCFPWRCHSETRQINSCQILNLCSLLGYKFARGITITSESFRFPPLSHKAMPHGQRCWHVRKVCFCCLLVLYACFMWLKWIHGAFGDYYVYSDDGREILFTGVSILLIPWSVLHTVLLPLQLYCLAKEIRQDLLWNQYWFCRIFVLLCFVTLCLYGSLSFDIMYYLAFEVGERNEKVLPLRLSLDFLTNIFGLLIIIIYIDLLFRPNISRILCKDTNSENQPDPYRFPLTTGQCTDRRHAFIAAVIMLFLYICTFVAVCVLSFKKLHCFIVKDFSCRSNYF